MLERIDQALTLVELRGRVADGLLVGHAEARAIQDETGERSAVIFDVPVLYVDQPSCLRVWVD